MMPCKEVARILSSDAEVGFVRRAELKMHLMMCKHCSAYNQHLVAMRKGFKRLFQKITLSEPQTIEKLENEVLTKLRKQGGS